MSYVGFHVILSSLAGLLEAVNNGDLDIGISTSRNLDVTNVNATEHGGEYDCIVSNGAGIGRATTILYVEPYFTLHPMDVTAYHGETATFTCMAESFPYPAYQWQKRQGSMFVDLPDETGTTLTVDVSEDSSEEYRCVAMSLIIGSTFSVYSNEATLYGEFVNGSEVCLQLNTFQLFGASISHVAIRISLLCFVVSVCFPLLLSI